MRDDCGSGRSTLFERRKHQIKSANIWKSNFINIWKKHGDTTIVEGVECFDFYRISGEGEGQKRMSNHLQDPELWKTTADARGVEAVFLHLDFTKLYTIMEEDKEDWVKIIQNTIEEGDFDRLEYDITNTEVTSFAFYKAGVKVESDFYHNLALYIAQYKLYSREEVYMTFSYAEDVSVEDVKAMIEPLTTKNIPEVEEAIRESMDNATTFDALPLVSAKEGSDGRRYYLPIAEAYKMGGVQFTELITRVLGFQIKQKGGSWVQLKRVLKLVLAAIAAFYGQFWLAASLVVGFAADEMDSKALKVASIGLSLLQGDISSLSTMGAGEAIDLIMNIYSVYAVLKYQPETATDVEAESDSGTAQALNYSVPYSLYDNIYCYDGLISVEAGSSES